MEANPFLVTKAVDFSDVEIADTFVDLPRGGFLSIASLTGSMPRFLVGGKGGGRTHLMRYSSYALQKLRAKDDLLEALSADGYIGLYFRCGGLNANRFRGKGQSDEAWSTIFAYYMDLWLAQIFIRTLVDVQQTGSYWSDTSQAAFCERALATAGLSTPNTDAYSFQYLAEMLHEAQRKLDLAINNVALTGQLEITVRNNPGELVLGFPEQAAAQMQELAGLRIVYLLDEFENLSEEQQRYINTLIREKRLPSNFIVGSRLFGLRTMETLSAGEENRIGSEYERVVLEETYSAEPASYERFCRDMVKRRLFEAGFPEFDDAHLRGLFCTVSVANDTPARDREALELVKKYAPEERPHLLHLRKRLREAGLDKLSDELLQLLSTPAHPLVEKLSVYLFFRAWSEGQDLRAAATMSSVRARMLLLSDPPAKERQLLRHWRDDLLAQLYSDCRQAQPYYGLDRFVAVSGFLPRNLMILLKQVTRWSLFLGEQPFVGQASVSLQAQREGVIEASEWYLADARALGPIGEVTQLAIRRLGGFFRALRFSDRPTEVSLCTFSTDRQGVAPEILEVLDTAVKHSLLLAVGSIPHRNSGALHYKYQIHPMLAPLFDLPTARRGVMPLRAQELAVIFDVDVSDEDYQSVTRQRLRSYNAPFALTDHQGEPQQGRLL